MRYQERKELRRELREAGIFSAQDLYRLGKQIYEDEFRDSQIFPRSMVPLTPLGMVAVNRYRLGLPNRILP